MAASRVENLGLGQGTFKLESLDHHDCVFLKSFSPCRSSNGHSQFSYCDTTGINHLCFSLVLFNPMHTWSSLILDIN
jgi:hypothetical protein